MCVARLACISLLSAQTDSMLFLYPELLTILTVSKKGAWFSHFGWSDDLLDWSDYHGYCAPHPKPICRALHLDIWKLRLCSFDSSMVEW
jgi:hypothetical protein